MFIEALEDRKVLDAEPLLVKDINTSHNPVQLENVSESPTVFGSIGLYSGYTVATGRELWRTDGTASGTYLVKDIEPGQGDSLPLIFVEMAGNYYFVAATSQTGRELWKTDGTEAGTTLVMDIYPGELSSHPSSLYAADGKLYFSATSPENGTELWTSDGTTAGTHILADIVPGLASNGVSDIYKVNNRLLFNTYTTEQSIASLDLGSTTVFWIASSAEQRQHSFRWIPWRFGK
jgi:ELWxxDGT repeat protein